jgi:hypothetical protein
MIVTRINPDYTLPIPNSFRRLLAVGQEVAISADAQGRLIVAPADNLDYVEALRRDPKDALLDDGDTLRARYAEFAQEDRALAAAGLSHYSELLQHEEREA